MPLILWFLLSVCAFGNAQQNTQSPFKENYQASESPQENKTTSQDSQESNSDFSEIDSSQNSQMIFLNAIQESFFSKKRKKTDNSLFIDYHNGETHNIRLRYAMTTTFIFANDEIAYIVLGDEVGFSTKILGDSKNQVSNIVLVKPLQMGVDTNLTIIGKSGKIYTFYLFSTTFTNGRNPAISVFVSSRNYFQNAKSKTAQNKNVKNQVKATYKKKKLEDFRSIDYQARVIDDGKFLKIGDPVNHLYIEKKRVVKGYRQKPKAHSKEAKKIMAIEIFNDDDFTYFKFNRANAKSKFPAVYKVVDGYDNPINTRVVGDYLIAEDVSDRWTLRIGEEWVCIFKEEKK